MTLRYLRIFLMVCETLNMTAAAKALYMTQPAVSQSIKEMETFYQVSLFYRNSKKIRLTDAGKKLQEYAIKILSTYDEMEQVMRIEQNTITLRIGVNVTMGVTIIHHLIREFKKDHSNVRFEITVNNSKTIRELLDQNKLDFAFVEDFSQMEAYVSLPYMKDHNTIVAWPGHPLADQEHLTLNDLKQEDFLLREPGSGVRTMFDSILYAKGISIRPTWESYTSDALIEATKAQLGVAVLPIRIVQPHLDNKTLIELKLDDLDLNRELIVIYHKGKKLPDVAHEFIRYAIANQ